MDDTINENIYSTPINGLKKCKKARHTALYSAVLLLGLILVAVAVIAKGSMADALYYASLTAGITLCVVAALMLAFSGWQYVYTPTGSVVDRHTLNFNAANIELTAQSLVNGDMSMVIKGGNPGSASARLDMLLSRDGQFGACQLYAWVPHSYEPRTGIIGLAPAQAAVMLAEASKAKA